MIVGVPKGIKDNENRVALTPAGAQSLVSRGHTVLVERGAGGGSGLPDEGYIRAGAGLLPDAAAVYAPADFLCKLKEPLPKEYPLLRPGQVLFTYLHLAPAPDLARALLERQVVGIAY